jgi:hypothetical protein
MQPFECAQVLWPGHDLAVMGAIGKDKAGDHRWPLLGDAFEAHPDNPVHQRGHLLGGEGAHAVQGGHVRCLCPAAHRRSCGSGDDPGGAFGVRPGKSRRVNGADILPQNHRPADARAIQRGQAKRHRLFHRAPGIGKGCRAIAGALRRDHVKVQVQRHIGKARGQRNPEQGAMKHQHRYTAHGPEALHPAGLPRHPQLGAGGLGARRRERHTPLAHPNPLKRSKLRDSLGLRMHAKLGHHRFQPLPQGRGFQPGFECHGLGGQPLHHPLCGCGFRGGKAITPAQCAQKRSVWQIAGLGHDPAIEALYPQRNKRRYPVFAFVLCHKDKHRPGPGLWRGRHKDGAPTAQIAGRSRV